MITTTFHKSFEKQYRHLKPTQKQRFEKVVNLFKNGPHHPGLYNHPLTGQWKGHRPISFGGDWRAHYIPQGKDKALFVAVGTPSQLYK